MTAPLVMRIMAVSINTAKRAGCIIRDILHKGNLNIVEKGKNDLQTEADRSAQQCIIASLGRQFPGVTIIGEEGSSNLKVSPDWLITEGDADFLKETCPFDLRNVKEEDLIIWVDPLDGTSEYAQGFLDHVTVLIGVAVKESAVGGIIHQPFYENLSGDQGRTIWGLKGLGVGGIQQFLAPQDKFIITTTRSHSNANVQAALDSLSPTEVTKVGGAGYKVLQLLEGKAHAYVFASTGCKKWDTCAPEAVLEAQGGILTDIIGQHYSYNADVELTNSRGVLATMRNEQHREIVEKIPKGVIDDLIRK